MSPKVRIEFRVGFRGISEYRLFGISPHGNPIGVKVRLDYSAYNREQDEKYARELDTRDPSHARIQRAEIANAVRSVGTCWLAHGWEAPSAEILAALNASPEFSKFENEPGKLVGAYYTRKDGLCELKVVGTPDVMTRENGDLVYGPWGRSHEKLWAPKAPVFTLAAADVTP